MLLSPLSWPASLTEKPTVVMIGQGLQPGDGRVDTYRVDFWCLHLFPYPIDTRVDGLAIRLPAGSANVVPPGIEQVYRFAERGQHLYVHFRLAGAADQRLPAALDLGDEFERYWQDLEEAIGYFSSSPWRTEARLWDVCSRLTASIQRSDENAVHPAVAKACAIIEQRLAEPLSIAKLAREVDLSHNQLTRLFRLAHRTTVVGYIRARRAQRAKHLLVHSDLPIKTIARTVGIDDQRVFAKLMRKALGRTPSDVRRRGSRSL